MNPEPQVTRRAICSMQVCVPADYTDEQARRFANGANPTGLGHGWEIRREGDEALAGHPERVPCEERAGCVHLMLDC